MKLHHPLPACALILIGALLVPVAHAVDVEYFVDNETELVEALDFAGDGDFITIRENITLTAVLPVITDDISIEGVLSSEGTATGISGDDTYRVIEISAGAQVKLVNIDIRDGNNSEGAGVYSEGDLYLSGVLFENCNGVSGAGLLARGGTTCKILTEPSERGFGARFVNCDAAVEGGGILLDVSSAVNAYTLIGVEFIECDALLGGGISASEDFFLSKAVFTDNTADEGGAIYSFNDLLMGESTVVGNAAAVDGGGLYLLGSCTIFDSVIEGNTATGNGGGLFLFGSSDLDDVVVSNNTADFGGGIYANENAAIDATRCSITSNDANFGGGLFVSDASESPNINSLTNCSIIENTAANVGGGMYVESAIEDSFLLAGCTIYGNDGVGAGGAMFSDALGVIMGNTVIAGNFTSGSAAITDLQLECSGCTPAITDLGGNFVGILDHAVLADPSNITGTASVPAVPSLVALPMPGPDSPVPPGTGFAYAPDTGSLVIDGGMNDTALDYQAIILPDSSVAVVDHRGVGRAATEGNPVDMGAIEFGAYGNLVAASKLILTGDMNDDFLLSQAEAAAEGIPGGLFRYVDNAGPGFNMLDAWEIALALDSTYLPLDVYVQSDAGGSGLLGTPADPFTNLQDAKDVAADGASIHIKGGTSYAPITLDEPMTLEHWNPGGAEAPATIGN